jgi:hypothetical protein
MSGCANPMMAWVAGAFLLGILATALIVIAAFELREMPRVTRLQIARLMVKRVVCPGLIWCLLIWAVSH